MRSFRMTAATAATIAFVVAASALPSRAEAQQATIPLRQISRMVATSTEMMASVQVVRELHGGRVLVNDAQGHRVILFDSTLATFVPVADTTSGTAKAYGNRPVGLLAFSGDTTLFVDPVSLSFLLITPDGKLGRVMAVPRPTDITLLSTPLYGAGFDAAGRLVYRRPTGGPRMIPSTSGGNATIGPAPDSIPLLRVDMTTRRVDTIASLKAPDQKWRTTICGSDCYSMTTVRTPILGGDDWTLLPDGSIALIRAFDYHIDWIHPDGSRASSPRIAHTWERLTDSAKVALVDSMKRADSVTRANAMAAMASRPDSGRALGAGGGPVAAQGAATPSAMVSVSVVGGGGGGAPAAAKASAGGPAPGPPPIPYVDPDDLPDYRAPFYTQTARVDMDGNIWIRVNAVATAVGAMYDVIDHTGTLIDRVQFPGGCTLVGFGRGVVYLTSRDGGGYHLARASIR